MTEDEMVGWRHELNGYEFEQTLEIVKDREVWLDEVHGVADRKSTRLNSSHSGQSRMPSSA